MIPVSNESPQEDVMNTKAFTKHKIVTAAAAATVAVTGIGAGVASAATSSMSAPTTSHVSTHKVSPMTSRLDALVKNGTITADQEKKIIASFAAHPAGQGFGQHGHGRGHGHRANPELAKALGLSTDQLRSDLESGKSLSQIASAQHKSQADVVKALQSADDKRIADRVAHEWTKTPVKR